MQNNATHTSSLETTVTTSIAVALTGAVIGAAVEDSINIPAGSLGDYISYVGAAAGYVIHQLSTHKPPTQSDAPSTRPPYRGELLLLNTSLAALLGTGAEDILNLTGGGDYLSVGTSALGAIASSYSAFNEYRQKVNPKQDITERLGNARAAYDTTLQQRHQEYKDKQTGTWRDLLLDYHRVLQLPWDPVIGAINGAKAFFFQSNSQPDNAVPSHTTDKTFK